MRLASVRSLKAELLHSPVVATGAVSASRSFRAFSTRHAVAERTMDDIALGVKTTSKKNDYRLAVRLQRSGPLVSAMVEEIRRNAKGEVDVKEIGSIVKFANRTRPAFYQKRRRPLLIGSSIGDTPPVGFINAGTLGCFVVRRSAPFFIGMLTNNHVIANENSNPIGSPVSQQGTLDGGSFPDDEVGALGKKVKLRKSSRNLVDAAVGDLFEGIDFDTRTVGTRGQLSGQASVFDLPANATVHKVGRTTGQTKGRITAFDLDNVGVEYDMGVLKFDNQIEIEGASAEAFSDSGDSGSLIVDEQLRAIGLLFAGGDVGGTNGKGLTYANPIETVLDELKVDLEI